MPALEYNAEADKVSWVALLKLFKEVLPDLGPRINRFNDRLDTGRS
jgi:hypothetical protein